MTSQIKEILQETLVPVLEEKRKELKQNPYKYGNLSKNTYPTINEGTSQTQKINILSDMCKDIGIDINYLIQSKV